MTSEFSSFWTRTVPWANHPCGGRKRACWYPLILATAACIVSIPNPGATRLMRLPRTLGVSHRRGVVDMSPGCAPGSGSWAQAASSGANWPTGDNI
jgi:hypothetical protein